MLRKDHNGVHRIGVGSGQYHTIVPIGCKSYSASTCSIQVPPMYLLLFSGSGAC